MQTMTEQQNKASSHRLLLVGLLHKSVEKISSNYYDILQNFRTDGIVRSGQRKSEERFFTTPIPIL